MWVVFNEHQFSSPSNTTHTQWLQTYIIDPNSRIECELYSRWTELVSIEWVYWIGVHWIQLTFCTLIQWIPTQFTFEQIQLTFSTLIQWTPIQFTFTYNSHSSGIPIFQMSCIWTWNIWIGVHLNVSGIEGNAKHEPSHVPMLAFPQLRSWGFDTGGQAGPKPDQLEKKIFELASSNQICDERESNPSRAEVAPGRGSLVILILSLSWRWIGAVRPHLGVD